MINMYIDIFWIRTMKKRIEQLEWDIKYLEYFLKLPKRKDRLIPMFEENHKCTLNSSDYTWIEGYFTPRLK